MIEPNQPDPAGHRELSESLRAIRQARSLSQRQVANEINVAESTYASWEREQYTPGYALLIRLADFYQISLDQLVGRGPIPLISMTEGGSRWRLRHTRLAPDDARAMDAFCALVRCDSVEAVAKSMGVTPWDVREMVQQLIVREEIVVEHVTRDTELERAIVERFKDEAGVSRLREVRVAKLGPIAAPVVTYVLLAELGRGYFLENVKPGSSIGLNGGFAVSQLCRSIQRGECPGGVRVYPIATTPALEKAPVSANSNVSAFCWRHYGRGVEGSELPFFLSQDARDPHSAPERMMERILDSARNVNIIFTGIGSQSSGALSRDQTDQQKDLLWMFKLTINDLAERSAPVGDLLYQLIDEHGRPPQESAELNRSLVTSIGLDRLKDRVAGAHRVVVLAAGPEKALVLRAAILGEYVNVLIIDDTLARRLLEIQHPRRAELLAPTSEVSSQAQ